MSNIITAGNATNNGTSISSDTSGVLELKSGATPTTALTISAGQVLTVVNPIQGGTITSGTAQASTSGTSIDFTGIPSWAKRITVMFNNVSFSSTDSILLRIGDSGGNEATGYSGNMFNTYDAGAVNVVTFSTEFVLTAGGTGSLAGNNYFGQAILSLLDASTNTWVISGTISPNSTATNARQSTFSGAKSLTATLDRLSVFRSASGTFDAGSINILYE